MLAYLAAESTAEHSPIVPLWQELVLGIIAFGLICFVLMKFVFPHEAAMRESGDVIAAGQAPAEIGEVIAGTRPGRMTADDITLFKSVGVAVEDVVSADLVYRAATSSIMRSTTEAPTR